MDEMDDKYVLEGHKPVPAKSLGEWARLYSDIKNRRVAHDHFGETRVSTVFLAIDHSWGEGPPILFETMVFGGPLDLEQDRCETWEQAEAMHKRMCERVLEAQLGITVEEDK